MGDASIFEAIANEVFYPQSTIDLISKVRDAVAHKRKISMRAGGTSLAGQAIGSDLVVDVSRHLTNALLHDDGDFAEAVRARIAELNARIEVLNIDIDIYKTLAQLDYFHAGQRKQELMIDDKSLIRITH